MSSASLACPNRRCCFITFPRGEELTGPQPDDQVYAIFGVRRYNDEQSWTKDAANGGTSNVSLGKIWGLEKSAVTLLAKGRYHFPRPMWSDQ